MARIKNLYAGRVATVVGLTLVATLGLVTGVDLRLLRRIWR